MFLDNTQPIIEEIAPFQPTHESRKISDPHCGNITILTENDIVNIFTKVAIKDKPCFILNSFEYFSFNDIRISKSLNQDTGPIQFFHEVGG